LADDLIASGAQEAGDAFAEENVVIGQD